MTQYFASGSRYVLDPVPIGRGAFGEVFRAKTSDARYVVVKRVLIPLPQRGCSTEIPINVYREWQAMIRTDHEHVVRALDVFLSGGNLCFVMEFMEGDLASFSSTFAPPPPENIVKAIMLRILRGLEHLHVTGIIHRVS